MTPTTRVADAPMRRVLPLRWVVALWSLILTTVVVLGVELVAERGARRALTEELVTRLAAQARSLAAMSVSAMLNQYPELTLHPLLVRLHDQQPELVIVAVSDAAGILRGDVDARQLGHSFALPSGLALSRTNGPGKDVRIAESARLVLVSSPILHPNGTLIGHAYLAVPRSYIDRAVQQARRPLIPLFLGLLALGAAGSFLLISSQLRPIGVLRAGLERIGRGDLDAHLALDPRTELGRLAQTINQMAGDLGRAQVQAIERERLAHELQLAQRIQRSLLPADDLVEGGITLVGTQAPASEVGGDFYDMFRLPDGRVGFVVADVAGKGLAGCLVTSMLAALIPALRDSCTGPAQLLGAIDRSLSRRLDRGAFVTAFVGFIDPKTGVLTFASAGHHPALLLHRDGGVEWLESPGLPVGADRARGIQTSLNERSVRLAVGDLVIQTTDGIHETEGGPAHEAFGFDRQIEAIRAGARGGPKAILERLTGDVATWRGTGPPADDETIIVASWAGALEEDSGDSFDQPMSRLTEAQSRGAGLKLPSTLDALVRLGDWIGRTPAFSRFTPADRALAHLALYELCANIVEHGENAEGAPIALWWVPDPTTQADDAPISGYFLILDQGTPFVAEKKDMPDLGESSVRRRGRGFGLGLTHQAADRVAFHPSAPAGNITLIGFRGSAPDSAQGAIA